MWQREQLLNDFFYFIYLFILRHLLTYYRKEAGHQIKTARGENTKIYLNFAWS
jgi:hypothetical protein